jgi:hypothetical protein
MKLVFISVSSFLRSAITGNQKHLLARVIARQCHRSLRRHYKLITFYSKHTMETKIVLQDMSLNTRLFFRKAVYSRTFRRSKTKGLMTDRSPPKESL